ncbi:MAG: hypothetical protein NZM25_04780 [Leptospiraceae bacterium]|nr:hypothetical protein [Leptospiraceae bacterium]MDW8305675.1 hypothetical protein [Leptospiraceae bacterium]
MKKITVQGENPSRFSRKVERALKLGPLGKLTRFSFENDQFVITFSQLGNSHLYYRVRPSEDGFHAELEREEVSLLHKAFRREVEEELKRIITRYGGIIEA